MYDDAHKNLFFAVSEGDVEEVIVALNRPDIDVNHEDPETGHTLLMMASQNGHYQLASLICQKDTKIDKVGRKDGMTALMMAAQNGHENVVDVLLRNGANPLKRGKDSTGPLMMAARHRQPQVIKRLLESSKGSGVNDVNEGKETALTLAAAYGDAKSVKLLVKAGAYLEYRSPNGNQTPLLLAINEKNEETAIALVKVGADRRTLSPDGFDALHLSAFYGLNEVVKCLLESRCDPNSVGPMDRRPLHMAARKGHLSVIRTLVEYNAALETNDIDHYTPLLLAVSTGQLEVVGSLVELGADVNCVDNKGRTALMQSIYKRRADITEMLLRAGARVNECGEEFNWTALLCAVKEGYQEGIPVLLHHSADVLATDRYGNSMLHIAVEYGQTEMLNYLIPLEGRPAIDSPNNHGDSPLMIAAKRGNEEAVRSLINSGARVDLKNSDGKSAYDLSANRKILRILDGSGDGDGSFLCCKC